MKLHAGIDDDDADRGAYQRPPDEPAGPLELTALLRGGDVVCHAFVLIADWRRSCGTPRLDGLGGAGGGLADDPVAAASLGFVEGLVGAFEQVLGGVLGVARAGDADGDADVQRHGGAPGAEGRSARSEE